jgi:prepilin peptidase CpaA
MLCGALAVLTAAAAWTDLRERRIPNRLAIAGLVSGLAIHAGLAGAPGVGTAFLGAAVALLVYVPLFALRAIGGGDVKLMAAVGALAGPSHWPLIFVLAAIFGGIWAMLVLLAHRSLGQALVNTLHILTDAGRLRPPYRSRPELDIDHPKARSVPHGVAIALGTLVFLVFG